MMHVLSTLLVLGMTLILLAAVATTMWFCAKVYRDNADYESSGFRLSIEAFESLTKAQQVLLEGLASEKKAAALIPQIVEALNLNTKALEKVEHNVGQLALRQASFVTRLSEKQTMVGEETIRPAPRSVAGAVLPTTRTESGEEGFVDETGKVTPVLPPTPREIAAMQPT